MSDADRQEVKELLNTHDTFYVKKWQTNGYYPIDKFIWNEEEGEYWVKPFKTKALRKTGWVNGNEGLLDVLVGNAYIISRSEFNDTKKFSDEGLSLIGWKPSK